MDNVIDFSKAMTQDQALQAAKEHSLPVKRVSWGAGVYVIWDAITGKYVQFDTVGATEYDRNADPSDGVSADWHVITPSPVPEEVRSDQLGGPGLRRYQSKHVVIQAMQYSGDPGSLPAEVREYVTGDCYDKDPGNSARYILLEGAQGTVQCNFGDFIIKEPKCDGYYPCSPETFLAKYEAVDAVPQTANPASGGGVMPMGEAVPEPEGDSAQTTGRDLLERSKSYPAPVCDYQRAIRLSDTAVSSLDRPGAGNAHHEYLITNNTDRQLGNQWQQFLSFQLGPIQENGINGIQNEDLLAIVIHRLECFQAGDYACVENAKALERCKAGLVWLEKRTKDRQNRGVEGTSEK